MIRNVSDEDTLKVHYALETETTGLHITQLIAMTKLDADAVLISLSRLNATQQNERWFIPLPKKPEPKKNTVNLETTQCTDQPAKSPKETKAQLACRKVLESIKNSGAKGITIDEMTSTSTLITAQIYNAMTVMRKTKVPTNKTMFQGIAYFTFGNIKFHRDEDLSPAPKPKTTNQAFDDCKQSAKPTNIISQLLTKVEVEQSITLDLTDIEQLLLQVLDFQNMDWLYQNDGRVGAVLRKKVEVTA